MRRAATIFIYLGLQCSAGAERYICAAEKTVGFKYYSDQRKWDFATFISTNKYVLVKEGDKWVWTQIGYKDSLVQCSNMNEAKYVFCDGFYSIRFNAEQLRYQRTDVMGYVGSYDQVFARRPYSDETAGNPDIEIGTCSPF